VIPAQRFAITYAIMCDERLPLTARVGAMLWMVLAPRRIGETIGF
jgi:hypothetical protein